MIEKLPDASDLFERYERERERRHRILKKHSVNYGGYEREEKEDEFIQD